MRSRGGELNSLAPAAQQVVDAIPLPALVHDTDFRIIAVNSACRVAANLSRTYGVTRDVFAFVHPTAHSAIRAVTQKLLADFFRTGRYPAPPISAMRRLQQDDDVPVSSWTHTGLTVIDGVPVFVVALDLANPISTEAEIWRERAERDDLTGLFRRNVVLSVLEDWLADSGAVTVTFADVDHFKRVNDGHGHAAGDTVLSTLADHLRALSHNDRVVCRYAGDEFLIASRRPIQPDGGFAWIFDEQRYLRRYIEAAADAALRALGTAGSERISLSIGAAERLPDDTAATLIHRADTAMYTNKAHRPTKQFREP
ncbi:sensor domain-containing diguanylate cyclase [Rhodococcus sp. IEGM 1354]|uniref:GGDEF domain-containing protein n=1 Tax=Rhodococcus sp. IEGM 1354 TaxID=3047088 RepID=UPI0024B71736|nr:sensor domain-containing diguanylate cyclase [Rhodococcus sp. IEGM 1354]MDI9933185.1 sensor domain-containing diguanylate cyclase [Rhodococcus sp. IEGM 1354]